MKNFVTAGVATALALGAVAAHASIVVGTTSGGTSLGDAVLFADVYNGSTFVEGYVGDTGISVQSLVNKTTPSTFTNSNLTSLFSFATTGTTVIWALEGAGEIGTNTNITGVSSTPTTIQPPQNGQALNQWVIELSDAVAHTLDPLVGSNTSALVSTVGANDFTPIVNGTPVNDANDWWGNTGAISTFGLGTVANIYEEFAANASDNTNATSTKLFTATLTASGLTFSPVTVPIPAALWLLGSGLLGLAGVARRKVGAA